MARRDWAVSSAVALGAFGMLGVGLPDASTPAFAGTLVTLVALATMGAWAYALADGAYGSRAALVVLVVDAVGSLAAGFLRGVVCLVQGSSCVQNAGGIVTTIALLASLWMLIATGRELAKRGGDVHWGAAAAGALPMVLFVLLTIVPVFAPAAK